MVKTTRKVHQQARREGNCYEIDQRGRPDGDVTGPEFLSPRDISLGRREDKYSRLGRIVHEPEHNSKNRYTVPSGRQTRIPCGSQTTASLRLVRQRSSP